MLAEEAKKALQWGGSKRRPIREAKGQEEEKGARKEREFHTK